MGLMPTSSLGERELDVASLIALWIAIHGGDPAPSEIIVEDDTAAFIAAALDRYLSGTVDDAGSEDRRESVLSEKLKSFGIERLSDDAKPHPSGNFVCFTVKIPIIIIKDDPPKFSGKYETIRICIRLVG
jgi:hypothetical protein